MEEVLTSGIVWTSTMSLFPCFVRTFKLEDGNSMFLDAWNHITWQCTSGGHSYCSFLALWRTCQVLMKRCSDMHKDSEEVTRSFVFFHGRGIIWFITLHIISPSQLSRDNILLCIKNVWYEVLYEWPREGDIEKSNSCTKFSKAGWPRSRGHALKPYFS